MKENAIRIINDGSVMPNDSVTTLKKLSKVFDLANKAINDINREKGVTNAQIGKEYAAFVTGVDSGSIIVHILTNFVAHCFECLGEFLTRQDKNYRFQEREKTKQSRYCIPDSY
ncbi:hypothetical protein DYE49_02485 [Treponema rectale]|uniref:Uncharacterized protein n=1 Tax=Treponema rectale TaxID=744512 RepID=A0A7M1XKQ0_9SPIR|nr:hypothetical protein DYE49_02485 [Treponema rectale]